MMASPMKLATDVFLQKKQRERL